MAGPNTISEEYEIVWRRPQIDLKELVFLKTEKGGATMTKIIGIILSAIFFFGLGDEFAFAVKKMAVIKVHQGLPSLTTFTQRLTHCKD